MMGEIVTKALELLVLLLVAGVFGVLIPTIKNRLGQEKIDSFRTWVMDAVMFAQQVYDGDDENGLKKDAVRKLLCEIRDKNNIPLTDEQINVMIEAAVRQMKLMEADGIIELEDVVQEGI